MEENCEEFTPKLFGSSSVWIDVRIQSSSSSSSELSWYITAEDQYFSDWYAYVYVLDEPSNKDCDQGSHGFCDSFCIHFPYSDNSYYPCPCNSVDGGYGNNEGLPDNSVLGYESVNKIRFYTATVRSPFYNNGSDSTTQPCEANVDIKLWYNSGNGGSFYLPTIPCFNMSSTSTESYDYNYYDYYNSVNKFDEENFSENENALIYGDNISEHLMFISCMASKEDPNLGFSMRKL